MTDFVLDQISKSDGNKSILCNKIVEYATFLKQPLTLGMFVTCDKNGNVLEEPKDYKDVLLYGSSVYHYDDILKCKNYQKAKSKVLFKDFYLDETYKREPRQLPYFTNGKISVFLHSDFAIRHQFIEDLVGSDLDLAVSF